MEKMVGGVSREAALQNEIRVQAGVVAAADPLPGPLVDAFTPCDIEVEGYTVRPLVAYDWAIMKKLNSPIYRQMLEVMQNGEKAKEVSNEPEEMWDMIFLLTRTCSEADSFFKKGVEAFRDQAKKEIGFKMNLAEVARLADACTQQIYAHMQTMVSYAAKEEEGEVKTFPQAEQIPATASAGG
jgi:hypothetical protein